MKDVRIFKTKNKAGADLVYKYVRPSQKVQSAGELVYRSKYSEAMRAGILLNAEVQKMLKARGIWDDAQEAQSAELRLEIASLEDKLKDQGLSNDDGQKVVDEIRLLRRKLQEHTGMLNSVSDNTCEAIATEERNQYFTAECIFDNSTGAKVYKSLEDFKSRLDDPSTVDCFRETVIASLEVLIGKDLPSDLQSEYAENRWLTERGLLKPVQDEVEAEAEEVEAEEKPSKKKKKAAE